MNIIKLFILFLFFSPVTVRPAEPYSATQKIKNEFRQENGGSGTLRRQNQQLSRIAREAFPAVVNISSRRKVTSSQMRPYEFFFNHHFFYDDFRRHTPIPKKEESLGSGFIISKDGYILTNYHVIKGASDVTVILSDGKETDAAIIGTDSKTDIALLKIKLNELPYLEFGNSDQSQIGEMVLALGNPFSVGVTLTMGIISAKGRNHVGIVDYENFIQTDAAINPGNSGGPLLNIYGEVIGVNTAILSRSGGYQGIGFSIPANMVKYVVKHLKKNGKVTRAYLGAYIQDLTLKLSVALGLPKDVKGVVISDIIDDSPAAHAHLKSGDIILSMDDIKIKNASQIRNKIAATSPDTTVKLTILRGQKQKDIYVKLRKQDNHLSGTTPAQTNTVVGSMQVDTINADIRYRFSIPKSIRGVFITHVTPRGKAARYGLRKGDIIRSISRIAINSRPQFYNVLSKVTVPYVCVVYRNGSSFFVIIDEK